MRRAVLPTLWLLLAGGLAAAGCQRATTPAEGGSAALTEPAGRPAAAPADEVAAPGGEQAPAVAAGGPAVDPPTSAAPPSTSAPGAVRDVLLVTIDTLRADAVGYSGGGLPAKTPTIDRLAAQGRAFLDAHAQAVVTLPSHTSILTGLYPFQHGVRANSGFELSASIPTLATRLEKAGFATAAVVAAFVLDARYGLDQGFDVYDDDYPEGSEATEFEMPERRGDVVVSRGLAWWRAHAGERRFLWVHLYDPHAPYEPPEPFASQYAKDPYFGEVSAADSFLRPLLEPFLDGKEPATLIVLTGDHGESLGQHGELTHGFFAYEPTLKIPLVLWGPGIRPGRDTSPVRHVDIVPTVLDDLGLPIPGNLPGRSLLRPAPPVVDSYFEAVDASLNRGWAPLRGMLRGDEKFISLPIPELYDLSADPGEEHNLAGEERRTLHAIAALLPAESRWPPERKSISPEESAKLASLGYLTGSSGFKETYTAADDPKNLVGLDRKLHQALTLYRTNRFDQAAALVREALAERPMGVGYSLLAHIQLDQGKLDDALETMREAKAHNMATASLVTQLGLSLSEVGRQDAAIEALQPLAEAGDLEAMNALGLVLSDAGRQQEARSWIAKVLARDEDNPLAHEHLALVSLREGRWRDAEAHARRALARNDQLTMAWNYLGGALYNLGKPHDAVGAWKKAIGINAKNFDALFNLALVAAELGDRNEARSALERFIAGAPPARYRQDLAKARELLQQMGTRPG